MQILQAILVDAAITVAIFRVVDIAFKQVEWLLDKFFIKGQRAGVGR